MVRNVINILFWNQWLALAAFFIVGDFLYDWNFEIAVGDTYLVIEDYSIGFLIGGFFLVMWCLFRFVTAFRSLRWLARIHVAGTTISTLLIALFLNDVIRESQPRRYTDYSVYKELQQESFSGVDWIFPLLLVFLFLQLSWIVQLVAWFYYKPWREKG